MVASSGKEAVANAKAVTSYDQGMCQKYVRDPSWRVPSLYGSAIDAWNGAKHKHPGDRTPPLGAPMYYKGGQYGHAVINVVDHKARMRSTDCTSATRVNDADVSWPESAWGYTYLGWTEDLNGVLLPLGGKDDDDMPLTDEDIERIAKRVNMAMGDYDAAGKQKNKGDPDSPDHGDTRLRQVENLVRGLQGDVTKILNKLNK